MSLLPRTKGALIRLFGENVTSTAHAFRFAFRIRRRETAEPDLAIVSRFVSLGDCVVDVGANGGDWSAVLARAVGRSGSVFAFEADPYYAKVTRKALYISGFRRVRIFDFGLSDQESTGHLRVVFGDGLRASGLGQIVPAGTGNTVPVLLRTLDSVLAEADGDFAPSLIKCDVEGHELHVLRGSLRTLQAGPIVIAEVAHTGTDHDTADELRLFLQDFGYTAYVIDRQKKSLVVEHKFVNRPDLPNRWYLTAQHEARFKIAGLLN